MSESLIRQLLEIESASIREDGGRALSPLRFYGLLGARLLQKGLNFLASCYLLRKANKRRGLLYTQGRPSIENKGYLEIGHKAHIDSRLFRNRLAVKKGARLVIGKNCRLNGAIIAATQSIVIGNNCRLAPFTHIMDGDFHSLDDRQAPGQSAPIVLGDNVWICAGSIVLKGVCINQGAIVAPGAVVTRDVEAFTMVGGVPAAVLRRLAPLDINGEEVGKQAL